MLRMYLKTMFNSSRTTSTVSNRLGPQFQFEGTSINRVDENEKIWAQFSLAQTLEMPNQILTRSYLTKHIQQDIVVNVAIFRPWKSFASKVKYGSKLTRS